MSGRNALTQSLTNILRIKGDNMNKIILSGNICKDVELRFIAGSGKAVASFDVAVKREFSKDKETDFFPVVVWGKQAENCANYLSKGSKVLIDGRAEFDHWEDKQGQKRSRIKIIANSVEFLTFKEKDQEAPQPQSDSGLGFGDFQAIEDDDDIPF